MSFERSFSNSNERYREKYIATAQKYWELQEVEKTSEEIEYEALVGKLEILLISYKQEIEELENKNTALMKDIDDFAEIQEEYLFLQDEADALKQLQKDLNNLDRKRY